MGKMIFWRLVQLPFLVWVIFTITFLLVIVTPGDPLDAEGHKPSPEVMQALREQYHLDNKLYWYFDYMKNVCLHGDLGPSMKYKDATVNQLIGDAMPVSMQLGAAAIFLALILGVGSGALGAIKKGGVVDWLTLTVALVGISLPTFVTGSVFLVVFALMLDLVPVAGWGSFSQLILPALTLSLPFAAYIARLTRMGMIDIMNSDYIRTARAKGLSQRKVIFNHALKVAFLPVLSFLGPATAGAMTGSFVVEKVFNIPGMGQYFVDAVSNKDMNLIMGTVLVFSTLLIVFNLAVDVAYSCIDPRIDVEN